MKRKGFQKKSGVILTTPSVLKRLKEADQERSEKENTKRKVGQIVNKREESESERAEWAVIVYLCWQVEKIS